ncbi:hypothetical protein [Burkholderia guangdongensis]|uniref:hypothetical protein n=1 Tax=Burkholderia guangdongensis TaxID=1792500 RepID=UPI0015CA3A1A|nr:hypothetical protein [Burkholderia guangdongensis]
MNHAYRVAGNAAHGESRPVQAIARPHGRRRVVACAALSTLCLASAPAWADDATSGKPLFDTLHLSGFSTLGLTYNDNDSAGVVNAYTQKRPAENGVSAYLDSVVGLQLEWRPLQNTSFVAQAVSRPSNDMQPELRMGYLRQQFGTDFAVRVGRIRSPVFFDSDVAEIGYAYMTVRPPIPVYGDVNSFNGIDGGDVQWRHAFGSTAILVQGYFGHDGYKHYFYNLNPVAAADASINGIAGFAVSASLPSVTFRVSRTWIKDYTFRSGAIDQLNAGLDDASGALTALAANPFLPAPLAAALRNQAAGIDGYRNPFDSHPIYTSIGFDATLDKWRVLGEWTYLDSRSAIVGKYQSYQITVGYTHGNFTPYVTYARRDRTSPAYGAGALSATGLNPALDAGLAQAQGALEQAARFADLSTRSASVGVRWDFRDGMDLKLQYDRITTPNAMTPGNFAVSSLPFKNTVNLISATFDAVF